MGWRYSVLTAAALLVAGQASAGTITAASVQRSQPGTLSVSWHDGAPVDVYVATRAGAALKEATLVSRRDADGHADLADDGATRRYFLLRDTVSGAVVRVAERVLPLERGSNFRDIGGYAAAGGKHVRWGMIYRSGATPLLSTADLAQVKALGLANMVDLRSNEERLLAPTRIDGVPYAAVGYPLSAMTVKTASGSGFPGVDALYRNFPTLLAPQLRILFGDLVRGQQPVAYNCSAGQDRTGFTTAVILTALGVSRQDVLADYHLSTRYRHPENEMPKIDVAANANNPIALHYAKSQQDPHYATPQPLYAADGTSYLSYALDEIDRKWGSVDGYLRTEIGMSNADLARLRATYLE